MLKLQKLIYSHGSCPAYKCQAERELENRMNTFVGTMAFGRMASATAGSGSHTVWHIYTHSCNDPFMDPRLCGQGHRVLP